MTASDAPLVSVVTPCLNAAAYIEQCIQSVKQQDYPNLEHVIVDGKSTDGTLSIIKKHERSYNMRWLSETDRSPVEAINKGLRIAKGAILSHLPSDDLLLPWAVGTVVRKFEESPETDLVYGDLVRTPYGGRFGTIYFDPPEDALRTHLRFNSIAAMTVFFRRRVFDSLKGLDEQFRIVSDYDFWLRAAMQFRFSKVDEALACFQPRKRSVSVGDPAAHHRERLSLGRKHRHLTVGLSLAEASYYFRRVLLILRYQLRLLSMSSGNKNIPGDYPWKNLAGSGWISPWRLRREILFSPLLSTNNEIEARISHGYVRMEQLSGTTRGRREEIIGDERRRRIARDTEGRELF